MARTLQARVFSFAGAILVLSLGVVLAFAQAPASDSRLAAVAPQVREFLDKARVAAERIDLPADKNAPSEAKVHALTMIAGAWLDFGEVDKAKGIAADLPDREKKSIMHMVPVALVHAGRVDDAVREAEALNDPSTWRIVCIVLARSDLSRAMTLAERVPFPRRDSAYESLIHDQIGAGNLKSAEDIADKVQGADTRAGVARWLQAGRFAAGVRDEAGAPLNPETFAPELAAVAEARAKAGDTAQAEKLLTYLKNPGHRSGILVALAEAFLKQDKKKECQNALADALKETAAISDPEMGAFTRGVRFLGIAAIQARAGDFNQAVKTVKLSQEASKAAAKESEVSGVVFGALGGNKALVGILLLAGKFDEAAKLAAGADGRIAPDLVPSFVLIYTQRGMTKELDALRASATSSANECSIYIDAAQALISKAKDDAQK